MTARCPGGLLSDGTSLSECRTLLRRSIRLGNVDVTRQMITLLIQNKHQPIALEVITKETFANGSALLNLSLANNVLQIDDISYVEAAAMECAKAPKTPLVRLATMMSTLYITEFSRKPRTQLRQNFLNSLSKQECVLDGIKTLATLFMLGERNFVFEEMIKDAPEKLRLMIDMANSPNSVYKLSWGNLRYLYMTIYLRRCKSIPVPLPVSNNVQFSSINLSELGTVHVDQYLQEQYGPGCNPVCIGKNDYNGLCETIWNTIRVFLPGYIERFRTTSPIPYIQQLQLPTIPIMWTMWLLSLTPNIKCVLEIPPNAESLNLDPDELKTMFPELYTLIERFENDFGVSFYTQGLYRKDGVFYFQPDNISNKRLF